MQLAAKSFQWGKRHPAGTGSLGGTRVLSPALLAFKARHHLLLLSSCPCHQPDPIAHPPQISAPWFAATGRTGLNRKPTPKRGFASPQHLLGLVLYITFSPKAQMRPPWSNVALASPPRPSHTCCCETAACRCFAPGLSSAPPDPACVGTVLWEQGSWGGQDRGLGAGNHLNPFYHPAVLPMGTLGRAKLPQWLWKELFCSWGASNQTNSIVFSET